MLQEKDLPIAGPEITGGNSQTSRSAPLFSVIGLFFRRERWLTFRCQQTSLVLVPVLQALLNCFLFF